MMNVHLKKKINAASSSCFVPLSSVAQVTMSDQREAETATKEANPIIDGRKANVNLAFLGAKPRNNPTTNGGKNQPEIYTDVPPTLIPPLFVTHLTSILQYLKQIPLNSFAFIEGPIKIKFLYKLAQS